VPTCRYCFWPPTVLCRLVRWTVSPLLRCSIFARLAHYARVACLPTAWIRFNVALACAAPRRVLLPCGSPQFLLRCRSVRRRAAVSPSYHPAIRWFCGRSGLVFCCCTIPAFCLRLCRLPAFCACSGFASSGYAAAAYGSAYAPSGRFYRHGLHSRSWLFSRWFTSLGGPWFLPTLCGMRSGAAAAAVHIRCVLVTVAYRVADAVLVLLPLPLPPLRTAPLPRAPPHPRHRTVLPALTRWWIPAFSSRTTTHFSHVPAAAIPLRATVALVPPDALAADSLSAGLNALIAILPDRTVAAHLRSLRHTPHCPLLHRHAALRTRHAPPPAAAASFSPSPLPLRFVPSATVDVRHLTQRHCWYTGLLPLLPRWFVPVLGTLPYLPAPYSRSVHRLGLLVLFGWLDTLLPVRYTVTCAAAHRWLTFSRGHCWDVLLFLLVERCSYSATTRCTGAAAFCLPAFSGWYGFCHRCCTHRSLRLYELLPPAGSACLPQLPAPCHGWNYRFFTRICLFTHCGLVVRLLLVLGCVPHWLVYRIRSCRCRLATRSVVV